MTGRRKREEYLNFLIATYKIAALGSADFPFQKQFWTIENPKVLFSFWFLLNVCFLYKDGGEWGKKEKKKEVTVNSLALIANISLPISSALDQNARNKSIKTSISFLSPLSFFKRSWKTSVIAILRAGLSCTFQGQKNYLFRWCQPCTHRETSTIDTGEPGDRAALAAGDQQLGNGLLRHCRDRGTGERSSNAASQSQITDACEPEAHGWSESEAV